MRITRTGRAWLVGVVVLLALPPAAMAGGASAQAGDRPFILDEYSLALYRSPETFKMTPTVSMGDSLTPSLYWFRGGRLSWDRVERHDHDINGWGAGVLAGIGYRPAEYFSPVFGVAVDGVFGGAGIYRYSVTMSAGVRVRVIPRLSQHYAMRLEVFRAAYFGESGVADKVVNGFAIVYTAALFQRK